MKKRFCGLRLLADFQDICALFVFENVSSCLFNVLSKGKEGVSTLRQNWSLRTLAGPLQCIEGVDSNAFDFPPNMVGDMRYVTYLLLDHLPYLALRL